MGENILDDLPSQQQKHLDLSTTLVREMPFFKWGPRQILFPLYLKKKMQLLKHYYKKFGK